jgi:L-ribulose-5-phosphate 4-epimerase
MLEELKERVCKANIKLRDSGLVILTWGNVSAIDRKSGLMVIKPSGVSYDELTPESMVVVNMDGAVVEGKYRPSSDTPTHLALYQGFEEIGAIVHTHSRYATIWAQAGLDIIAYGTTHADYFYGDVPCTMPLEENMIESEYERNTGYAIIDTFARRNLGCMEVPACLVAQHGPFTWGDDPEKAVENAIVLEEIAHMAVFNTNFQFGLTRISDALLDKHYLRKHGEGAYYGQTFGSVQALDPVAAAQAEAASAQDIQIAPSNHTVELKNISEIASVERPTIIKAPKKEEEVFKFDDKISEDAGADMSDDFELTPLEPDAKGDDLMPASPDPVGFAPIPDPVPEPIPSDAPPAEPLDFTF